MMSRTVFLLSCLLAAGITVVSAQSITADETSTATADAPQRRSLPEMYADSEKMRQVYAMMSTEELSVFARRIYLVKRFQAKKMNKPVPEKLPEDMLSDRERLIEYIIENSKE
jgi:hypothetical protein